MDLSRKIVEGIAPRTNPEIEKFIEETEGMEGPDLGFLQIGLAISPEPLKAQNFIQRGPYANPSIYKRQMDESVERGWLDQDGEGEYKLSEKGQGTVQRFMKMGNQLFSDISALPDEENRRIADLLAKLVDTAYKLPQPAAKPIMEVGVRLNPGADAAPMLRVRRHLTDLNYYREDVHIAAWQPFYGVDGRVFETLTNLWREQAATPAELAEQLSEYRGYDEDDYTAAFEELVAHGWAAKKNSIYTITEDGIKIRQEAEDRTDEYFARPFSALSELEMEALKGLLEKLAEAVKPPETEEEDTE
jgi:DNA-binding MarR family transcriptional regulator